MHTKHACLFVMALLLAACDESGSDLWIEPQATPFYWYQDTRIYLAVDPGALTVEADSAALPAILAALAAAGLRVDTAAVFSGPDHWLLALPHGVTADRAADAARALRMRPDVRFASTGYRLARDTACTLKLTNLLAVSYLRSTTQDQIRTLQARAGFTVISTPTGISPWWALRYPVQSRYTPLEIAAAMDRHPYVEWADPDMVQCFRGWPARAP